VARAAAAAATAHARDAATQQRTRSTTPDTHLLLLERVRVRLLTLAVERRGGGLARASLGAPHGVYRSLLRRRDGKRGAHVVPSGRVLVRQRARWWCRSPCGLLHLALCGDRQTAPCGDVEMSHRARQQSH
jgi:hypothetical protein